MFKTAKFMGIILVLGMVLSSVPQPALAQDTNPPQQENTLGTHGGAWFDPQTNLWRSSTDSRQLANVSPLSTGGPDDFGYTWDSSVALSWIDATNGTVAEVSNRYSNEATGPIALPFTFKYYENSYSSLYITAYGYVSFLNADDWPWQPHIPSPSTPNTIVAPYATPINIATTGTTNRAFYKSGGTAPNRYFVTEWYQAKFYQGNYTFEVVLYENGDIVFQYQQMTYDSACGYSGIEDASGMDGLMITSCSIPASNTAIHFYRPAPAAHVNANPLHQGRFSRGGEMVSFPLTIRNTGELGSDTYDLIVNSPWPATILSGGSGTALVDTDSDGMIDTGALAMGGSKTVSVNIQTPTVVNMGDNNTAAIQLVSSLDVSKSKALSFQTAIPSPFTQVFRDDANGAMSLDLVQPNIETVKKVTSDSFYGYDVAVAETGDGFAYFWERYANNNNVSYADIEYTLLDRDGKTVRGVSKLTDNAAATVNTYEYSPAVAVAPNGRIGVTWYRRLYNSSTSKYQYNMYFAILDSTGNIVSGPTNLTNNSSWGTYGDLNFPNFYSPRIAATSDNRFTLAWEREHEEAAGYVNDIYYGVKDSNGGTVKAITKLTNDTPGYDRYFESPGITALNNNRVMLAWTQRTSGSSLLAVASLDSAGNLLYSPTELGWYGYRPDMVQLSTGQILIAATGWGGIQSLTMYSLLDETSFSQISGPTSLDNPNAMTGDEYVSVTSDLFGHGILTWMDYDYYARRNLYYALVDNNGAVLTQPMIFQTTKSADARIETSYEGYGNTTNQTVLPTTQNVDLRIKPVNLSGGPKGGIATIPITIGNYGSAEASTVVLTATLDNNLTFVGAVPVPTSVVGKVVTWNLDDMGFLGNGQVTLQVSMPATTIGTRYPINWSINSAGPEANPLDNAATTHVMESIQIFLPKVVSAN